MKLILFLVIFLTFNQLISSLNVNDTDIDESIINNSTSQSTIKPLSESTTPTTWTPTIKPLITTQSSSIDSTKVTPTISSSTINIVNDDEDDQNVSKSTDDDYDENDDDNNLANQSDDDNNETLDGQAQSQRPFIRGRDDQTNQLQPTPNYGLPFANLLSGLQNGLINNNNNNNNGNNQRGQLTGPLDLLTRFLPTARSNNNIGPLTNSFNQPGINQGYPNYPGLGNQNFRPSGGGGGVMNGRLPSGNFGNNNRLGSQGTRFNGQQGLGGQINNGGGITNGQGRGGQGRRFDDENDDQGDDRQEPGSGGAEETDQGQEDGGVNQSGENDQGGEGDNGAGGDSGQNEAASQDDESSKEGGQQSDDGQEDGGGGDGGDMGEGGGGDPANDPDLAQFEGLSQGSNFPGDLFPPGLLSQQDLADIQKSMDEQAKKDAERQRQGGGDEQGDSSNSSPTYDDQGVTATDQTPSVYNHHQAKNLPNHRGAYRNANIQNQRKFGNYLNSQQSNQQIINKNNNQRYNYLGDYGQRVNNQPSAYPLSSRKFQPNQGQQLNEPISNKIGDVDYLPDLIYNNKIKPQSISSSSARLNNVPHQSTINNNYPTPTVDYDDDDNYDEKHSSVPV